MPQTIGEFINNLAQKAGVAADSEELKALLASPELAAVKVPDTLIASIDNGLLNIEAAKNNHPDIKKKYFADAYDGMDKQLLALVANDTFDQADVDEIKAEKSTSKKAELIISKLKAAKANATGADKAEINKQLTAAHEAARLAKLEVETVRGEYEGKIKDINRNAAKRAVFGNYKTIYDEMDPAVKTATMDAIINKALQDKNADLSVDDNGNLVLIGKDGSNVFGSDHRQLTPKSFLDQSFAPILKVSGLQKPDPNKRQPDIISTKLDDKTEATVQGIRSHTEKVLADMATAPASMI